MFESNYSRIEISLNGASESVALEFESNYSRIEI